MRRIPFRRSLLPAAVLLAVALSGCGGGGGGSVPAGPAPSTKLLIYSPGNQWTYAMSGKETLGGVNFTLNGTETHTVSQATVNNESVLAITTADNFTVGTQQIDEQTISYITQNPTTGDVTLVADTQGANGTLRIVSTQQVTQKGTFADGQTSSSKVTFNNGDTDTSSQTVQGHTEVTVPAGTYNSWQMLDQKTDTNGTSSTDTEWWPPSLGDFVKADVSGAEPGFSIQFTLTLTSTNVTSS